MKPVDLFPCDTGGGVKGQFNCEGAEDSYIKVVSLFSRCHGTLECGVWAHKIEEKKKKTRLKRFFLGNKNAQSIFVMHQLTLLF